MAFEPVLMKHANTPGGTALESYKADGGYEGAAQAIKMSREELIELVGEKTRIDLALNVEGEHVIAAWQRVEGVTSVAELRRQTVPLKPGMRRAAGSITAHARDPGTHGYPRSVRVRAAFFGPL